jgi:hypothetical protein
VVEDQAETSVVRERTLLVEALTLLMERQQEAETELTERLARTNSRVVAVERRFGEIESRLAGIEERLLRLATEVEPDPGVSRRVATLQAHVERLQSPGTSPSGAAAQQPQETRSRARPAPSPAEALIAAEEWASSRRRAEVRPEPEEAPEQVSYVGQPIAQREQRSPAHEPTTFRRVMATPSGATLWDRLGSSNQDRASVLLIAAGVLVVVFAALAQIRFG